MGVLTDLEQLTPKLLTTLLGARGVLPQGAVEHLDRRRINSSSQVAHLTVRYTADTPPAAPQHLVLKVADSWMERRMPRRNRAEIAFYTALQEDPRPLPVVRCYAAAYEATNPDHFHLLLADPSASTHVSHPYSAVPPTLDQCALIVDALALVHARCWGDLRLGQLLQSARPDEPHTGAFSDAFVPWVAETLPRFLADLGDRIPADRQAVYARIGALVPERLIQRQASGRALTLTQGDVHAGNFLYPRETEADRALIIDWKRAGVTFGASDLAYMMALYWFPSVRQRREQALLRVYHERLLAYGITDYAWDELWDDYRLAVLRQFFEAIWGWSVGQGSLIWWNHLERVSLAIAELDCLDLL